MSAPSDAKPLPSSQAVSRLLSVPLVHGSLQYLHATLAAYPQLLNVATASGHLATGGLRAVEPLAARLTPQLQYVDGLAVKGIDVAQQRFPYAFHATPSDVAHDVKAAPAAAQANAHALVSTYTAAITDSIHKTYSDKVVAPAKGVYEARVVPTYTKASATFDDLKEHNEYVKAAVDKIAALHATLADRLAKATAGGKQLEGEIQDEAVGVSRGLIAELDKLRAFVTALPAETAARFRPVKDTVTDAYAALAKQAAEPSVPVATKLANIIHYVRFNALPHLQQAIHHPDASAAPPEHAQASANAVADKVADVKDAVAENTPAAPTTSSSA